MSNLKKPTIIILSLVLFYPLLIILLWSVILGSILLSKNDYLNGTSRYSGDEKLYADQAMKMTMYHEGSHIIPAGASFVYVKEIKYQKSDKLCIKMILQIHLKNSMVNTQQKLLDSIFCYFLRMKY